jgi:hypothetical protein
VRRRPLVIASRRVREAADTFLPGVVFETLCEHMICASRVVRDRKAGPKGWLILGDGWVARAYKERSPLGTRKVWRLYAVEQRPDVSDSAGRGSGCHAMLGMLTAVQGESADLGFVGREVCERQHGLRGIADHDVKRLQ